jgi:PAS domain S-box-containing protein
MSPSSATRELYQQGTDSSNTDTDQFRVVGVVSQRLRFESLLARLSADFIHLPPDKVDGQIEHALRQLAEFLQVERCGLGQFSEDGSALLVTHSYAIPGFTPFPHADLAVIFPWLAARIRHGDVVRLPRLPEDLPPEADSERQFCLQSGLRSYLAIPFNVGESILGGIGFESYHKETDWSEDLERLTLIGEVFANALARKRADLVLRESEGRFRLLADTAPVMVWMSGLDRLCTYFNQRWLDFTGRPIERELGNGWSEGVHAEDVERCLETYVRAFDARQEFRMEYRLRRFDGEYRWVLDTGVPRFEPDGAFEGYIGSCIDITDQKRVEEALRQREAGLRLLLDAEEESRRLRDQLARVGRISMMGELSASIAHEVNQPLCAIVSNAQTAQRMLSQGGFDLPELLEALGDISQDAQRASAVIARIRGLLQQGTVQHGVVDVNELIREMAALLRTEVARRGVLVKLELTEGLPGVLGDRVQLQQVILNLMTNAADAMDGVGADLRQLTVRSLQDGMGCVTVAVQDTGIGLEVQNSDRIFDAFFTTKRGGTGMGLAICKSIVEAHGGRIDARPAHEHEGSGVRGQGSGNAGAVFRFTLPGRRDEG